MDTDSAEVTVDVGDDMVEVVVEDGDSDSSYWMQTAMWHSERQEGQKTKAPIEEGLSLVQVDAEIERGTSSSASSSSTSSLPTPSRGLRTQSRRSGTRTTGIKDEKGKHRTTWVMRCGDRSGGRP